MERRKSIMLLTLICFILIVSVSWFARINVVTEKRKNIEVPLTFENASKEVKGKADPTKEYFFKKSLIIEKRRSLIPFVYKKDTTYQSKQELYSRNI